MRQQAELFMSKMGFRGLVSLMGLVKVVSLAVLQMKSLADLHELGLTVATMKMKDEYNVEKDLDKTGGGGKMSRDAVYGQDIERLRPPKRERRRRAVDDIGPEIGNNTMNNNHQHIQTPTGTAVMILSEPYTLTKRASWVSNDLEGMSGRFPYLECGAVYTRWGRTRCPDDIDTEIVYSGISAGTNYNYTGNAVNTLCLPHEPIWGTYTDNLEGYAFIYGAEYHDVSLFKRTNAEGLLYHNMPCVVCRSRLRTSTFMLPARNRCFGDWHVEYHGYLMTGHHVYQASTDYICVDQAPEADPSGFRVEYGRLLYRVEAICGSLPCPQYNQGRELTCAICSK